MINTSEHIFVRLLSIMLTASPGCLDGRHGRHWSDESDLWQQSRVEKVSRRMGCTLDPTRTRNDTGGIKIMTTLKSQH